MIPCLYASTEMKFNHNGIGKLADAQSCTVTEKRNGSYELKLVCPADGIHAEMLEEGNIILAKPSDTMQSQPFRIYKITTPIDGKLEVQARHISYQLNFITVSPFSVTGCAGAMQGLKSHAASDCPFDVWTDVDSSATFTLGIPSSFRNCLGGMAGSVLDVFGGEFEWDRYTVKFHKTRGTDHNVHIIYGKNLTDFKMEKSIENTITGVHPYWVDNETQAVMELPEKVVLQSKRSIPYQKITVLDCTSNFQEKPSEAALREYAQNYIDTTDLTEPEIDIKIDFLQLWNTPGYEDIVEAERVSLCDTVHVFISKLGIEVSSKVTETEYDALLERYNSITLSNSTVSSRNSSLTGSLNSIRNTATIAYDTAVRAETAVGEQVGGITASIIYDGALFAALFGLHYKNETDNKGNTTRYAFNAATLKQSTVAWKNSSAGLFVSTDGGKTWGYPVWRCKRKVGERDGEPPKNGSPDQKAYCRSKKGCMSDEEKEAANKRCPSERYHECALEQSFMELLYSMKRDFEQHGDASMIVAMFDNAYEQAVRLANNNSISVQRMATVENQIKEMEERLQDAISHQVAALREAALEQNVELNEALSNGEVTIDDIDLDIRSGLTPGSIGVSFYGTETEEGSEAQIYTELVNDLQERLKTLQQERQTIEEEQGVLAIMKKNFEYFLACLKELPDTNAGGMPLRVNGLDVQGTLLRDVDGNAIEGRKRAITSGKLKLTPERIAEAPDMLHFEKGIYCAFVESGVLQGDVATYKTNFGVTLTSKGNRRTLDSFMGYKRSDMDGNVVYVDAPYKVYGFSIQYRRYLTTAAKREREEAV